MAEESHVANPPSAKRLLWLTLIALVAGSFIVLCLVLPAEFHLDPTGFGRVTGLSRLAGPKTVEVAAPTGAVSLAHEASVEFRTDVVDIPLASGDELNGSELEYKVYMKEGDTLVYSWEVAEKPPEEEFYYDFHSQSDPTPEVKVTSWKQANGTSAKGSLVAPFPGYHGWYYQNQSAKPVSVQLHIAGFYRLVSEEELRAAAAGAPPPQFPTAPPEALAPPAN